MKTLDPTSPLLKSVIEAVQHVDAVTYRTEGMEDLYLSLFADFEHGCLAYDSNTYSWGQLGGSRSQEIIGIEVSNSGEIVLREGDDDGVFIETSLQGGDEINELLEFFISTKAESIKSAKPACIQLGSLIDSVFLMLPESTSFHPWNTMLIPLKGLNLSKIHSSLAETVNAHMLDDWSDIGKANYPKDVEDIKRLFDCTEKCQPGDLVLSGQGFLAFGGILNHMGDSRFGRDAALVLRPKNSVSLMWLFDYFKHAAESEGLIQRICRSWQHLPKGLQNVNIQIPATKTQQVANAIERRNARNNYIGYLKRAMAVREPFDEIATVYRKRTEAAKCLHSELLDDITALRSPLPFFLEYPYRNYVREDDHIRKVKAGQRLLSVLAKVPLYFVVEELLGIGDEVGTETRDKLFEKPASDGFMVGLQRDVANRLMCMNRNSLTCFDKILPIMGDGSCLEKIVAARNRMHHEPFDEHAFLVALDEHVPALITQYRTALRQCQLLIPHNLRVVNSRTILTAENLCSRDACFPKIEIEIGIGIENFPSDKMVAYSDNPESSVILKSFFASKLVASQSRDVGLFDRVDKSGHQFVFLRSD